MIVGYDYDGTWTHRMPKSGPDEFIIGLFVANTGNTLKSINDPRTGTAMSLEEYIRQPWTIAAWLALSGLLLLREILLKFAFGLIG